MSKRITILGAGESGVGAAILAKARNMEVFVSDLGKITEKFKEELQEKNIPFEEGGHSEKVFEADEVIKSPGIPDNSDIIGQLNKQGIKIISELEFASRYTSSKIILITGTNGKTTTTLLTHHLLNNGGIGAGLTGNVGNSFARMVAEDPKPVYVVEASSFQLDQSYDLKADVAVLLNITPDHLDRYDNLFSKYVESKFRVIRNMKPEDSFIYNYDDDVIKAYVESHKMTPGLLKISLSQEVESGGFVNNDEIIARLPGKEFRFDLTGLPLKGYHNAVNMMASILCAMNLGLNHHSILEGLKSFRNAPHRMEKIATIDGVDFINDSKATNVDSASYALGTYPAIVWIAGGKDKGNNYQAVNNLVKQRVKALICLGKDNTKLLNHFEKLIPKVEDTHSIKEAVNKAMELAEKGDTVLLSPACASFDLFKSYEDRGNQFRNEVILMKKELESKTSKS